MQMMMRRVRSSGGKGLLAIDALVFFDLRGGEPISRKALVADRISLCEQGHWGTLWPQADMQTIIGPKDDENEMWHVYFDIVC